MKTTLSDRHWRLAFAASLVILLILATLPQAAAPSTGWDKADHLFAFAALMLLGHRAFPGRLLPVALGLFAYGLGIEALQGLLPYRFASWQDAVANTAGLALGALLALVERKVATKR